MAGPTKPAAAKPAATAPAAAQAAKPAATAPAVAPGAASEGAAKQGAAVVLAGGERRIDFIRRRFKEGAKRGEIAKELGVAYQIVFAATKAKKETAPAPAVAATK